MRRPTPPTCCRHVRAAALAVWLSCITALSAQEREQPADGVSLRSLLRDLQDPARNTRSGLPASVQCRQWSSHDPRSRAGAADPAAWYANDDRGHYVRVVAGTHGPEHVLADCDGPGFVARIWSANPRGRLFFDIDGQRVWSVDFERLCRGEIDGVPPPLAGMRARGGNVHLPIPFGERLVLSAEADDLYYHVDVARLPAGTKVRPFGPSQLVELRDVILGAAAALGETAGHFAVEPSAAIVVPPQHTLEGFRVIVPAPERDPALLARVLLVVRCGDEQTVRVPLVDFFAAGPRWTTHRGRFLRVDDASASCGFVLPMPAGGEVRLVDEAEPAAPLPWLVAGAITALASDRALLFRAHYHQVHGQPTRPFSDHLVLDAVGEGVFVGCSLVVRNPSRVWWGEGDEKVFVDGEHYPSWFGTGTEDYFGYAWCDPTPFASPLHAQVLCQGPDNFGFTVLHRSHALDAVPFRRRLRFEFERWHWVEDARVDYRTVAYWYGAPGARASLPETPPAAERALPWLEAKGFVAEGALEGEALEVLACTGGVHEVQDLALFDDLCSGQRHRWWRDAAVGDELVLAVPVPADGRYRLEAAFVCADDFGIVALELDGRALGAPFDGYRDRLQKSGPVDFGSVGLTAGHARLTLRIVGQHERAKPRRMVGLDYVRLLRLE